MSMLLPLVTSTTVVASRLLRLVSIATWDSRRLASQASNCHRFATEIKKTVQEEDQKQFERNLSKNLKLLFVAQPRQSLQDTGLLGRAQ
jgi:hypothetical protein